MREKCASFTNDAQIRVIQPGPISCHKTNMVEIVECLWLKILDFAAILNALITDHQKGNKCNDKGFFLCLFIYLFVST